MRNLSQTAIHTLPSSPFIYSLIPLSLDDHTRLIFAAITSENSLISFTASPNGLTLHTSPHGYTDNIHSSVTCLTSQHIATSKGTATFFTAGRDGAVHLWYSEVGRGSLVPNKIGSFHTPENAPISALAVCPATKLLAAGTEHAGTGPGDVCVYVWDTRAHHDTPLRAYTQSHSDTITNLAFFAPRVDGPDAANRYRTRLLSGSTDGLVMSFDLAQEDEDDAVISAINTQGPVNHILPVRGSFEAEKGQEDSVWSVSHDEKLSLHSLADSDAVFDVRKALGMDYTIRLSAPSKKMRRKNGLLVWGGRNKSEEGSPCVVSAVFQMGEEGQAKVPEAQLRLDGAHGEEVVRDVWMNEGNWEGRGGVGAVTVGEDGSIRVWGLQGGGGDVQMEDIGETNAAVKGVKKQKRKEKAGKGERFAPY